jgi:hypothetical protein
MRGLMAHREPAPSSSFYPSSTLLKIKLFDYTMTRVNFKKYLSNRIPRTADNIV